MVAPLAALTAFLPGIAMLAVGALAILGSRRRTKAAWRAFAFGWLAWAIAVGLKLATIPACRSLDAALLDHFGEKVGMWLIASYVGLRTGIFECGLAWAFVRWTRVRNADHADAVAFGVGFGAVEAVALGLVAFVGSSIALYAWNEAPESFRTSVVGLNGVVMAGLRAFERAYALVAHLISCLLVVRAVQSGRARWLFASIAFKTFLDAIAVVAAMQFGGASFITNAVVATYVAISALIFSVALTRRHV